MRRVRWIARAVAVGLACVLPLWVLAGCNSGHRKTASNPITIENARLGTSDWQITGKPADDVALQVRGYASATSADVGESLTFFVTVNPVQSYGIDIYRIGYYQGLGGRLMVHVPPKPGTVQPRCPMDRVTGLIACKWSASYNLPIPQNWTSGVYLAKLTNDQQYQSYIVFTVRDDARRADLLYQQSVTTYQAYNDFPYDAVKGQGQPVTGKSLYEGGSSPAHLGLGTTRAAKVSFDRPYASDNGAGNFLDWEVYYVRWLERSGYDVAYSTDVDTHRSGKNLLKYKGFLSVGHDEYWTREMYDSVLAARDAGVGVGFFGANAVYWQMRFEPSASGAADRIIVCYKDAKLDPTTGATSTVRWRDPPVNRPEQQLIGVQFVSEQPEGSAPAALVPNKVSNWVFRGSHPIDGKPGPRVVGYETDRQFENVPLPVAVPGTYTLLSDSPYKNAHGDIDHQNSVIYQAASGAWVFGAGSIEWSWGLYSDANHRHADPVVQAITTNVLNRFLVHQDPLPARPTNLSASVTGSNSAHITWTDNATDEKRYVLERSTSNAFANATAIDLRADATSYVDSGLVQGVYYYRVHAVNDTGESPYSETAVIATESFDQLSGQLPGLLARWRLDDLAGSVSDNAGDHAGSMTAGVTTGVSGAITNDPDAAMGFDGSHGALKMASLPSVDTFTITGWTELNQDASKNDSGDNALFGSDGAVRLLVRPGVGTTTAYAGIWVNGKEYVLEPEMDDNNIGSWVFWALSRSGNDMTLYRNGVAVGERTDLPSDGSVQLSNSIGAQDGTLYPLHGSIDEVAIYRSALTADQVSALYQAALVGPKP
jgi:hypothetical protein